MHLRSTPYAARRTPQKLHSSSPLFWQINRQRSQICTNREEIPTVGCCQDYILAIWLRPADYCTQLILPFGYQAHQTPVYKHDKLNLAAVV